MYKLMPLSAVAALLLPNMGVFAAPQAKENAAVVSPSQGPSAVDWDESRKMFAAYPRSAALDFMVKLHMEQGRKATVVEDTLVVFVTRFADDSARKSASYWVTGTGKSGSNDGLYDVIFKHYDYPRLSDGSMAIIRETIRSMPPSNAAPSVKDLVIVTYAQGSSGLVTRLYDATKLPAAIATIEATEWRTVPRFSGAVPPPPLTSHPLFVPVTPNPLLVP